MLFRSIGANSSANETVKRLETLQHLKMKLMCLVTHLSLIQFVVKCINKIWCSSNFRVIRDSQNEIFSYGAKS